MRPSLVHDALYQLMRSGDGALDRSYRRAVDRLMLTLLREEGMNPLRAWWSYAAVRLFGGPRARRAETKVLKVG